LTEEGKFNYAAYLLSDTNNISVKVAKYAGNDRVELIENNEYGYCSLVKATKQVLDKIQLENKTLTEITYIERKEKRLWALIALREAIINAFVHSDYTKETPPKFEIFNDRIEITSAGGIPEDLSKEEFFEGYSVPRNKEIMRVFKDLDLVEHLGSGIPRILESYGQDCFRVSDNFLRITFFMERSDGLPQNSATSYNNFKEGFGNVSERTARPSEENIAFLRSIYGVITGHLQGIYGINAEEVREVAGEKALFIIQLIAIAPEITRQNMADILGISLSTVEKTIRQLRESCYIDRTGADKTGKWKIVKQ
jgi:predicted HTH transcriptional regulator